MLWDPQPEGCSLRCRAGRRGTSRWALPRASSAPGPPACGGSLPLAVASRRAPWPRAASEALAPALRTRPGLSGQRGEGGCSMAWGDPCRSRRFLVQARVQQEAFANQPLISELVHQ